MRLRLRLLFLLSLFCYCSSIVIDAQETPTILWQKKIPGYLGEIKVANNGNVLFFRKPDMFGSIADLVAVNTEGLFYWNKRFTMKIRNFDIAPSGNSIVASYLQPNQTGNTPVITYIDKSKEVWQMRGGEYVSFSPGENHILCFNDGKEFKGIFLYNNQGKLIWYLETTSLIAGQPDLQGKTIYGLQDQQVIFLDTATSSLMSYPVPNPITSYAFDVESKLIFVADQEKVMCFDKRGAQWEVKANQIYKLVPDSYRQRLVVNTPGKAYLIPYEHVKEYTNEGISEEQIIRALNISDVQYRFSENLKYLVVCKDDILTLYQIEAN